MNSRTENKISRVLRYLASGRSLNRFDAEKEVHDHCLPSTVSEIQARFGLTVDRVPIEVPGFCGLPTRCTSYWIGSPEDRERAREILENKRPAAATVGPESGQDCEIHVQWEQ